MSEGFKGTIDWVGYSVGTTPQVSVGFRGLLDFVGYPVGVPGIVTTGNIRRLLMRVGLTLLFYFNL